MPAETRFYQIRDLVTHEVVHQFDVSGRDERSADKIFSGLCNRVDFDRFYLHDTNDDQNDDQNEVTRE